MDLLQLQELQLFTKKVQQWARDNSLDVNSSLKTQSKKIAEEMTEAIVHLQTDGDVADDIGDILIASSTYIINVRYEDAVKSSKGGVDSFVDKVLYYESRIDSFDEIVKKYYTVMLSVYDQSFMVNDSIELACAIARFKQIDLVSAFKTCVDTVCMRKYSNPFERSL